MKESTLNIPDHNDKVSGQQVPATSNEIFNAAEFNAMKNKINSTIANHRAKNVASATNMLLPNGKVFHVTGDTPIQGIDDTDLEGGEFLLFTFENSIKLSHNSSSATSAKVFFSCGHNFTPDPERDYLLLQYKDGAFYERNDASMKPWQLITDVFPGPVSGYQFNVTDETIFNNIQIFDAIMHEHSGSWHYAMVIAKGAFSGTGQVTIIGAPFDTVGGSIDSIKFAHNKVVQLPIAIADDDFAQITNDILFAGATGMQFQIADCYILGYATKCVDADTGTAAKICVKERESNASILTSADGLAVASSWTYSYGLVDTAKYAISGMQDLLIDILVPGGNKDTKSATLIIYLIPKL